MYWSVPIVPTRTTYVYVGTKNGDELQDVIKRSNPDVACLQEIWLEAWIWKGTTLSKSRDKVKEEEVWQS